MTTGMEYFLVLAEEGSIGRAAQRLYVTQQSMSEQMKRLEDTYGVKLFLRRPRFALTPAGEALLATLRQIRVLEQGLGVQLRDIQEKGGGCLRVGLHAPRARIFLPRAIQRFHALYPQVELEFFHDDTLGFEQMLLNGELDLFLGVDARPLPELEYIPLAREPIYLAASQALLRTCLGQTSREASSLTPQEVEKLPLILSHGRSNLRQKAESFFRAQGICPRRLFVISDLEIQLELAGLGLGACFCPRLMLQRVRQINEAHSQDPLYSFSVEGLADANQLTLALHRRAYRSPALKALLQILQEEFLESLSLA